MNRRNFLQRSAGFTAAIPFIPQLLVQLHRLDFKVGFQTWVVREEVKADFNALLKKMAGLGYETLELCSPPEYAPAGFAPLMEYSATEIKTMIADAGLTCTSCHYPLRGLKGSTQERIDFAKELGLEDMVISSFGVINSPASMDAWKKACDDANEIGVQVAKHGMQLAFHNHHQEFTKIDDVLIYDVLLDRLDPELCKMQFQVAVITEGYVAADYFRAHPGRFISAHLADYAPGMEEQTSIGNGVVDWPDFFVAAKENGLKNIYVEIGSHLLPASAEYLHSL